MLLNYLEKETYNRDYLLTDEEDVLESFVNEYNQGYICDIITEIADSYTPIYYNDIWENARNISDYIEDTIQEFGVPETKDFSLEKIFQMGYYQYYTQLLYNNLREIVYNHLLTSVESMLVKKDIKINKEQAEEIKEILEDAAQNTDNNDEIEIVKNNAITEVLNILEEDE